MPRFTNAQAYEVALIAQSHYHRMLARRRATAREWGICEVIEDLYPSMADWFEVTALKIRWCRYRPPNPMGGFWWPLGGNRHPNHERREALDRFVDDLRKLAYTEPDAPCK